tara:strand:+ start:173 stop:436 length:264 start_codon:yes stop_codon:yes gene_type:complete
MDVVMRKQTRSILQELNSVVHERDRKHLIESRGNNIIQSAINLIEEIHRNYDEEISGDLERRIINSIKHRDSRKFARGIDRINEAKT